MAKKKSKAKSKAKKPKAKKAKAKAPKKKKAKAKKKTAPKAKAKKAKKKKAPAASKKSAKGTKAKTKKSTKGKGSPVAKKKSKKKTKKSTKGKGSPVAKKKHKSKSRGGIAHQAEKAVQRMFGGNSPAAAAPPKGIVMHVVQKGVVGTTGAGIAFGTQKLISKLPIKSGQGKAWIQTGIGFLTGLFTDSRPWLRGFDSNYHLGIAGVMRAHGHETMAGEDEYHVVVDKDGNLHEMTTAQLEQLHGNLEGNLEGNLDGESGFAMRGEEEEALLGKKEFEM